MKTYNYSLTTNTIWTSFDFGQVQANNAEEARILAEKEIKQKLDEANKELSKLNISISMDFTQLEISYGK
jgi:hypothetical protein